jgi:UDP-N-acetylglucosamine enolpyruvyl transferase
METFYTTIKIELEDKTTGVTQNIKENPIYTFQATPQDGANRFLLHFNGVTAVEGVEASQTKVYSVDNALYVSSLSNLDADILVYNVNGQLVAQEQMNGESLKKIDFQAAAGIYLVSIQSEGSLETQKVYVK